VKHRESKTSDDARVVSTRDGLTGSAARLPGQGGRMLITLADGRSIVVAEELLKRRPDGSYQLELDTEQIHAPGHEDYAVIPIIREELEIQKSMVETGRGVRIHKRIKKREEEVVQLLYREQLDLQHVPVNRLIEEPLPVRYEGTTMVIPLCEEVLVIEKRLLLKEEIHVTRREGQVRHAEKVVLRSEEATIERFGDQKRG